MADGSTHYTRRRLWVGKRRGVAGLALVGVAGVVGARAISQPRDLGIVAAADGTLSLAVSRGARELYVKVDGETVASYPVSVGGEDYPTPSGSFTIRKMIVNPAWIPPKSEWAR